MEQRNEMLKQMRLTKRQKRGEVQHLIARSFSRRAIDHLLPPSSPPGEISIPVPILHPTHTDTKPRSPSPSPNPDKKEGVDTISIGDLSLEPRAAGAAVVSIEEDAEQLEGGLCAVHLLPGALEHSLVSFPTARVNCFHPPPLPLFSRW